MLDFRLSYNEDRDSYTIIGGPLDRTWTSAEWAEFVASHKNPGERRYYERWAAEAKETPYLYIHRTLE